VNGTWRTPVAPGLVLGHLSLVGSFSNDSVDPVIWSLVHEMRVSLVFPVLVAMVLWATWRGSLVTGVMLSVIGYGSTYLLARYARISTDYLVTLQYVVMFIVGILLARGLTSVRSFYTSLPRWIHWAWTPAAAIFYTYAWLLYGVPSLHKAIADDLMTTIGATMFIVLALSSERAGNFLSLRSIAFLGRISYSLYLLHALVILALVKWLYGSIPTGLVLGLALVVSVTAAWVSYVAIERPSMSVGRSLANRIDRQRRREAGLQS
jgi:peptidoglycan/LPS O-acetylase OafA/YrhL